MKRCETCKHFEVLARPNFEGNGHCGRMKEGYHVHEMNADECLVEDDEGWGNEVGPKFGCVLHEPK